MNTVAYVFILAAAFLVRGMTKGRRIDDLPDDIGDAVTALIEFDTVKLRAVLDRTGTKAYRANPLGTGPANEGQVPDATGVNGRLDVNKLVPLTWSPTNRITASAARDLEALNATFRAKFGRDIKVTDSYRSFADQVLVQLKKGKLAATPGKSTHGLGRAVDLGSGINRFGTVEYKWMMDNAPRFGWVAPEWARQGGSKPEPWHWEHA